MGRSTEMKSTEGGPLRRAANAVKRVFGRGRHHADDTEEIAAPQQQSQAQQSKPATATTATARATRRQADIPLDVLDRAYTPPITSSKASFRSDGEDHQQDQEFSRGVADADWNDEDHFTNKSGDPRIGTHNRTYEPDEDRPESPEQR